MKQFILFALIGLAVCDKLPSNSAPYEPSGWKPQGAQLALPSEYGPPQLFQQQPTNVEVNQENIQFAGQISETTPQSNEYLPPAAQPEATNQVKKTVSLIFFLMNCKFIYLCAES